MPSADIFRFAPRNPHEPHRASSSLELVFDLASVIAIAAAAHGLAHAVESGEIVPGIIGFLCSLFMIWWAWMNFTWFASAYDDDSPAFRALTMIVMFGALMLAAGIDAVFRREPIWLALLGFVIMRAGMAVFWLGAARGDPVRRPTTLRYAGGIALMQVYWIAMVALAPPHSAFYLPLFVLGAAGELAVPAIAERLGATAWHRHHMIERYGLLNIIVLAEIFVSIAGMIQLREGAALPQPALLWLAILAAIIAFSLWSLYFAEAEHLASNRYGRALLWGYGHVALFAAGAATGAGLTVMLAVLEHTAHIGPRAGALAVAIPVAIYLGALWLIRDRFCLAGPVRWLLPAAASLILLAGLAGPFALETCAALLVITALIRRRASHLATGDAP